MRLMLVLFVALSSVLTGVACKRLLKFTNVKCMELPTNNGLTKYDYCRLKVVRRNYVELSLRVSLLKLPITNVSTRFQCFQRTDGYRPFVYNVYFDFCKLMGSRKSQFSIERFVFDTIREHSNFNQSCPWKEDHMIIERFALDSNKLNMPVPAGYYRLDFTFYAYGIARTLTQVFFEKLE